MTVGELIKRLENENKDKVVILKDYERGWTNIATIESLESTIALIEDTDYPFSNEIN